MTQTARPVSDVTTDSWTTTPLWSKINDASDSTYITGPSGGGAGDTAEVKLAPLTDPVSSSGHIVYIRAMSSGSGTGEDLHWNLYQGDTSIAGSYGTCSRAAPATWGLELTGAQADAITDYTDLRVRFFETVEAAEHVYVYDVWMECPDAPFEAGEAALQAVATITADGTLVRGGAASLQGVATITPEGLLTLGGESSLTGVARLTAEAYKSFTPDFSRYDAYIEDDVGPFGVVYHETADARNQSVTRALQPTRQDVGNNPFEIRPESGNTFSQGDFSHGANQRYYHHLDADPKKYLRSEGFDVSEPGRLAHLHATTLDLDDASVGVLEQANGLPFVASGHHVKRGDGNFPGTWTEESPNLAEGDLTVNDLCSSGVELYAALGANGIHRRDSGGTWTHYNACAATRISWVKNRIMAADGTSIYEVTSGSAPTAIETLPSGWLFEDIFEAGAYVYACAVNTTDARARVHIYGFNSGATAIEKRGQQDFPYGQLVESGSGYLNSVSLGAGKKNSDGGYDPVLYLAAPDDDGFLEYTKVAEEVGSGSADLTVRAFAPLGERVLCGWSTGTASLMGAARAGLAAFSLGTSAFSHHLRAAETAASVRSILPYRGRVLFSVSGVGVYAEDLSKYVSQATLVTSVADWNNAGDKVWDFVEVSHAALPAATSVHVDYATEVPTATTDWKAALTSAVEGSDGASARTSNLRARLFAVRLTSYSNPGQTAYPETLSLGVRSNPSPSEPEYTLSRYIRLAAKDRKDSQAEEVNQDVPELRRRLLGLAFQWIKLYEPDDLVWIARVESIDDTPLVLPESGGEQFYVARLVFSGTLSGV